MGSQSYNSFAFAKSTLSEYPYEGFATYQEAFEMREGLDPSGNDAVIGKDLAPSTKPPVTDTKPPVTDTKPPGTATGPKALAPAWVKDDWRGPPKTVNSPLYSKPKESNSPTTTGFSWDFFGKPKTLSSASSPKPKEGFETMITQKASTLAGSSYGNEKPVAFLYNNEGSTTCKNYGYTNSKGFICMSASDIQLLTTRGGNAAGVSEQIGK